MVGAVLVHEDKIIGEGYHQRSGDAHAEVNAINSVHESNRHLIGDSTLFVSLEPCCTHGKTPPCTDLILHSGIGNVVISTIDPNPAVRGKGISKLRARGVNVEVGLLESEGQRLIESFGISFTRDRPYIIIKYVQSADGFIGREDRQVWLSNSYESTLVHKLRSEVDSIMVGTNTAVIDNPRLTNRYPSGDDPLRITIDFDGRIPASHHILDDSADTLILTGQDQGHDADKFENTTFVPASRDSMTTDLIQVLNERHVRSLLVEGGSSVIKAFAERQLWDELWVVTVDKELKSGVRVPEIHGRLVQSFRMEKDSLCIYKPTD